MKYEFILDENNYIYGFKNSEKGIEFDPSSIEFEYITCYKLVDNKVILDEEKKEWKIATENKEEEINELKNYLLVTSDTANDFVEELLSLDNPVTFISDFIALIKTYRNTYKTILAERKTARDRLKELEKTST